jgi:hypothetical protein
VTTTGTDLRVPGTTYVVAAGQEWWINVADGGRDLTGCVVETSPLWASWADRTPREAETITIRRADDEQSFWFGQPAGVAAEGGVFYLMIGATPDAPAVTRAGIVVRVGSRGTQDTA